MDGMRHEDRSRVEPAYLTTADPGTSGGGTAISGDTQQMLSSYENVFGPAAREIKWDSQRHKRHQRWHLPDALKGANSFLTDRIDGLITDATSSPFTKNILPYLYMDQPDRKIKWNVYAFDEGIASRVPYESAARVLPQSKRSFAGYAVRQGLAIAMEHNFMMSPGGMENFRRQLMQLVGSIQLTNDLDVHMALLHAPSYQKHMDEKYWDGSKTLNQQCRMYVDLFGFVQKNENALDYLIEDAKNHLTAWGSKAPTFMLCNGALTRQMNMNPEKTNYITAGPDGQRKLAQGPDLPSYRGLSIINTRQFSLEVGSAPRDMLRRRVRVSEHYRIPWEVSNMRKRFEFYDQSRDSMFYLSWTDLWRASLPDSDDNALQFVKAERSDYQQPPAMVPRYADNLNGDILDGSLRANMFTEVEITLGALLGIWKQGDLGVPLAERVHFLQDIEIVYSTVEGSRKDYGTVTLSYDKINSQNDHHVLAMLLVKKMLKQFFPWLTAIAAMDANVTACYAYLRVAGSEFINAFAVARVPDNASLKVILENTHQLLNPTVAFTQTSEVLCLASDLFILRPNIEHYMLAVIFGRGGGPEELGATFWGQTELSCYDDSQHGIWGMSYKYHERAIVTNERNLIRVFDVCFDGYCGGNDARIMQWKSEDVDEFRRATMELSAPYAGPSMLVMSLPRYKNVYESFPNPLVWHTEQPSAGRFKTQPDRGSTVSKSLPDHCPFISRPPLNRGRVTPVEHSRALLHEVYSKYYHVLGLETWANMNTPTDPGPAAFSNETDPYVFSFHGHMAAILDGQREETQGSGHLGSNFVGVASVREGRGMLPRGMPTLAHLV
jgi:hypothetical protein